MMNPEQTSPNLDDLPVEDLVDSFGAISRMPEETLAEARAKRDAFNHAITVLNTRLRKIHNETQDNSQDDNSQEESADEQQRGVIRLAEQEFHRELSRLHDVIVKIEG